MDALFEVLERDGFVKIPPDIFQLDRKEVEDLRLEIDRIFDGEYDTGIYPDEIHWRRGISKETATREVCNAWKANLAVRRLVCSATIGQLACKLMKWKSCRIGQDDVLYKPPGSGGVGFHQDGTYISDNFTPERHNCLTMWIAIDDADEENGALQYVPGSHRWKSTDRDVSVSSFHVGENDHRASLVQLAGQMGKSAKAVLDSIITVPVSAGEMIVHHQDTWHGSGPNQSTNRPRRAIVAHLLDGQVLWRDDREPQYIYGRYYIRGEKVPRSDFFPFTYSENESMLRTSWLDH